MSYAPSTCYNILNMSNITVMSTPPAATIAYLGGVGGERGDDSNSCGTILLFSWKHLFMFFIAWAHFCTNTYWVCFY